MRRLLIVLLILGLALPAWGAGKKLTINGVADVVSINGSTFDAFGGVTGESASPEYAYFGNEDISSATSSISGYAVIPNPSNITYTCPGTGNRPVTALEANCMDATGDHCRLAIYDTSGNFVMQGSAEFVCPVSVAWTGHTAFVTQAGDAIASPVLTGGTAYLFAMSCDGASVVATSKAVTSGYSKYSSNDYTGGFPATLTPTSNSSNEISIRCQVQTN